MCAVGGGPLLKLPGAPQSVGLQAAAQGLLGAVDALRPPATSAAGDVGAPPDSATGASWDRGAGAATVLRDELKRPGGYHRGRARGVIERLTGVTLGAAQESALDVWGVVYGLASGILHGRPRRRRPALHRTPARGPGTAGPAARARRPGPGAGRSDAAGRRRGGRARPLGGPARRGVLLPLRPGAGVVGRPGRARPAPAAAGPVGQRAVAGRAVPRARRRERRGGARARPPARCGGCGMRRRCRGGS